jgi:hypothetical protein
VGYAGSISVGAMTQVSILLLACAAVLSAAACGTAQEKSAPVQTPPGQRAGPLQGAADWRQRMQMNHSADSSIEQQVRRLTADLNLTTDQQAKVRQLSREHNARIQKILDTAPDTLTYQGFQTQVHAISADYHTAVNAILTPHQLELMNAMVGRLDSGQEARRARPPRP